MDAPPPSYPFGIPEGVDGGEWHRQWCEWEARRAAKGIFGLSMAEADAYRQNYIWPADGGKAIPIVDKIVTHAKAHREDFGRFIQSLPLYELNAATTLAPPTEGIWQDAPYPAIHEGSPAWHCCLKRWRMSLTDSTVPDRSQMILEVATNGGAVFRHIIFLDQVEGIVTMVRDDDNGGEPVADAVEEVIIDICSTGKWVPSKLKLLCMGNKNSLALQQALIDFLGAQ